MCYCRQDPEAKLVADALGDLDLELDCQDDTEEQADDMNEKDLRGACLAIIMFSDVDEFECRVDALASLRLAFQAASWALLSIHTCTWAWSGNCGNCVNGFNVLFTVVTSLVNTVYHNKCRYRSLPGLHSFVPHILEHRISPWCCTSSHLECYVTVVFSVLYRTQMSFTDKCWFLSFIPCALLLLACRFVRWIVWIVLRFDHLRHPPFHRRWPISGQYVRLRQRAPIRKLWRLH